jgi:NADH-quinone oxidoreductase subunit H
VATLFLGGWDIPLWSGDDAFWYQGALIRGFAADGAPVLADPAWWKTLLTLGSFLIKTSFFVLLYIWVRWTLPRFRYDQVMSLGWKVMLPTALSYVIVVAGTVLVLDEVGVPFGFGYAVLLALVSLVCTGTFMFVLDRGRIITGAGTPSQRRIPVRAPLPHTSRQIPAGTHGD